MSTKGVTIGVLDIQGSVKEHLAMLKKIGVKTKAVKIKKDLDEVDGLIIPGGESTTIGKLLKRYRLDKEIKRRAKIALLQTISYPASAGSPAQRGDKLQALTVWGTCAGAILLAKHVLNCPPLGLLLMDITIERNAYGRQLDSFETKINISALQATAAKAGRTNYRRQSGAGKLQAVFIRAPIVKKASNKVKTLAKYNGSPVMLQQDNLLVTTFHPELTNDPTIHKYFIEMTKKYAKRKF